MRYHKCEAPTSKNQNLFSKIQLCQCPKILLSNSAQPFKTFQRLCFIVFLILFQNMLRWLSMLFFVHTCLVYGSCLLLFPMQWQCSFYHSSHSLFADNYEAFIVSEAFLGAYLKKPRKKKNSQESQ